MTAVKDPAYEPAARRMLPLETFQMYGSVGCSNVQIRVLQAARVRAQHNKSSSSLVHLPERLIWCRSF
ncbi:hypothetical protein CpipJ_CPIJ016000 [Culex quinquefasciatus]|uniref:Uncharacterized protein n=1 Tax=Culex quinquefasciatus TaxID=7176 RepID=B0XBG6_CULQU|nr:hypothetical protein CpipJ_CPIJ016000 [Culex quinquefasciatus]|eukprot:XP_001866988.1 hypothetical protein CpipJ_CPIJ016000 [Culex quinquefasciatus]